MLELIKQAKKLKNDKNYILQLDNDKITILYSAIDGYLFKDNLQVDIINCNCTCFLIDFKKLNELTKYIKKIDSIQLVNDNKLVVNGISFDVDKAEGNFLIYNDIKKLELKTILKNQDIKQYKKVTVAAAAFDVAVLKNICIDIQNNKIACTDGNRLHVLDLDCTNTDFSHLLIPASIINKGNFKTFDVLADNNNILIKMDNDNKLILINDQSSKFPDYLQLIPKINDYKKITFDDNFIKILKSLPNSFRNELELNFKDNKVIFKIDYYNKITNDYYFELEELKPEYDVIGVNKNYLLDFLNLNNNTIYLHSTQNLSCIVGGNEQSLLMPTRL